MLPLLLMMLQIGWNDHYWDPGWCTKPYTSCSWCCCWCWFYQGFLWSTDDVYWFCEKGFYYNPMFDMLSRMNVLLIAAAAIFLTKGLLLLQSCLMLSRVNAATTAACCAIQIFALHCKQYEMKQCPLLCLLSSNTQTMIICFLWLNDLIRC